jgi:NAD(P)-dependent dehydrogenase (short-subunit alcohol dehydrogenase family)
MFINADGTLKMCRAFLESMQNRVTDHALKIINFSSVGAGIQTFPGFQISELFFLRLMIRHHCMALGSMPRWALVCVAD